MGGVNPPGSTCPCRRGGPPPPPFSSRRLHHLAQPRPHPPTPPTRVHPTPQTSAHLGRAGVVLPRHRLRHLALEAQDRGGKGQLVGAGGEARTAGPALELLQLAQRGVDLHPRAAGRGGARAGGGQARPGHAGRCGHPQRAPLGTNPPALHSPRVPRPMELPSQPVDQPASQPAGRHQHEAAWQAGVGGRRARRGRYSPARAASGCRQPGRSARRSACAAAGSPAPVGRGPAPPPW